MSNLTPADPKFYKQSKSLETKFVEQSGLSKAVFEKEVSFACQHIAKNPYLLKCDPKSFLQAILNLAQTGLTLNPLKHQAALVPRSTRQTNKLECCLDPMYQGYIYLLTNFGAVSHIEAGVIFANDDYEINLASPEKIVKHSPWFIKEDEPGDIVAAYSLATLPNGDRHAEIMSRADIVTIRDKSESYKAFKADKVKSAIWEDHFAEMCRKTVIKRHYKYLPKGDQFTRIEQAIEYDNEIHGSLTPVTENMRAYIDELMNTYQIDQHILDGFRDRFLNLTWSHDAEKLLADVQEWKPETVNPTQKEIREKVESKVNDPKA